MPHVSTRGVNFYYEDVGSGAPVVLLGGTLGTARGDFSKQIDTFAQTLRVIAPDRRGYGNSRPPQRDYPDDFYQRDADDMAALMDALDLAPATVLGWSEGADVALCLAATAPNRVARIIAWGGLAAVDDADIANFEARRDVATWPRRVCEALTATYGETYWADAWAMWCDVMVRLHAQGGDVGLAPLERISCPALIVHGANDPLIRATHAEALQARIRNSVLHVIDGSGHNPHLTDAATFNRLVLEFIGAS